MCVRWNFALTKAQKILVKRQTLFCCRCSFAFPPQYRVFVWLVFTSDDIKRDVDENNDKENNNDDDGDEVDDDDDYNGNDDDDNDYNNTTQIQNLSTNFRLLNRTTKAKELSINWLCLPCHA